MTLGLHLKAASQGPLWLSGPLQLVEPHGSTTTSWPESEGPRAEVTLRLVPLFLSLVGTRLRLLGRWDGEGGGSLLQGEQVQCVLLGGAVRLAEFC